MRSSNLIAAAVCVVVSSGAAWAITQTTEITITDKDGTPVKSQEVTFTVHEPSPKSQPGKKLEKPRQISQVKKKTDDRGRVVLTYNDEDLKRGAVIDIVTRTDHGIEKVTDVPLEQAVKNGQIRLAQSTATETAPSSTMHRGGRTAYTVRTRVREDVHVVLPSYSGLEFLLGADVGWATARNHYDDFPAFDSHGFAGGGHLGMRYYFQPNVFAGFEFGGLGTGIRGTNPDGAFANYGWELWEMGQLGVTWTPAGITTPITLYGGGGFAQGGVRVGVNFEDEHESMSKTLSGYILRAGADMYLSPVFSIGASYSFSQFRGTIDNDPVKAQINMVLVNGTYHIPAH